MYVLLYSTVLVPVVEVEQVVLELGRSKQVLLQPPRNTRTRTTSTTTRTRSTQCSGEIYF